MTLTKGEKDYITKEIKRSGFPLEIEVAKVLEDKGWEVDPSSPYRDYDQGILREIDLIAHRAMQATLTGRPIAPYSAEVELVIECKKSEEFVWVFFPRPRGDDRGGAIWTEDPNFVQVIQRQYEQYRLQQDPFRRATFRREALQESFYPNIVDEAPLIDASTSRKLKALFHSGVYAPRYFECLLAPNRSMQFLEIKEMKGRASRPRIQSGKSEIFEAVMTLAKAVRWKVMSFSTEIFHRAAATKSEYRTEEKPLSDEYASFSIAVVLPLIIFEGKLCSWSEQGVIEEKEILLEGRCHTERYNETLSMIVVSKDHFIEFIQQINEDLGRLAEAILLKKDELDKQTELIVKGVNPSSES